MTIRMKSILIMLSSLLVLLTSAVVVIVSKAEGERLLSGSIVGLQQVAEVKQIAVEISRLQHAAMAYAITRRTSQQEAMRAIQERVSAAIGQMTFLERETAAELAETIARYSAMMDTLAEELAGRNRNRGIAFYQSDVLVLEERIGALLGTLAANAEDASRSTYHAFTEKEESLNLVMIAGGAAVLATIALLFRFLNVVLSRLFGIGNAMMQIAAGAVDTAIPDATRSDEVGRMARSVQYFRDSLIEGRTLSQERVHAEREKLRRVERTAELLRGFSDDVARFTKSVSAASVTLEETAATMNQTASGMKDDAAMTYRSAEEANTNVEAVARAAEELDLSIREINEHAERSSGIVRRTVASVDSARATLETFANAASRITAVVEIITGIAKQTNLLALNATMEAARAGAAGSGFGVVAQEVKKLSGNITTAAGEISGLATTILSETQTAVDQVRGLDDDVRAIDQLVSSIAGAIEEQSAATRAIARNVETAAQGASAVRVRVLGLDQVADVSKRCASNLLDSSDALRLTIADLQTRIDGFVGDVRAC